MRWVLLLTNVSLMQWCNRVHTSAPGCKGHLIFFFFGGQYQTLTPWHPGVLYQLGMWITPKEEANQRKSAILLRFWTVPPWFKTFGIWPRTPLFPWMCAKMTFSNQQWVSLPWSWFVVAEVLSSFPGNTLWSAVLGCQVFTNRTNFSSLQLQNWVQREIWTLHHGGRHARF